MLVIGLTGGIATGKSTVANYLSTLGYAVCDTDSLARQVVEKGSEGIKKLVKQFGECILLENGALNREKLAQLIFNHKEYREIVNRLLHPLIFEQIEQWKKRQQSKIVFIDMPLLFEVGYDNNVDMTIVVEATYEQQLTRLQHRNHYTVDEAKARIFSQMPIKDKVKRADIVIDNSKDKQYTQMQVKDFLNTLNVL